MADIFYQDSQTNSLISGLKNIGSEQLQKSLGFYQGLN